VTGVGRHERAVANTLGFARERTRAGWFRVQRSAEVGRELPIAGVETAGLREAAG
jgi:alkylated DNA nucleotide flippase Atl1